MACLLPATNLRDSFPIVDLSSTEVGKLMVEAGCEVQGEALPGPRGWRGSLSEVEPRIKRQTAERAKAVAALENLLLTDDARAQHAAESQAFYTTLATMMIAADADGMTLIACDLDGEPLPVEKMTEAQRSAFEKFVAVAAPRQTATP